MIDKNIFLKIKREFFKLKFIKYFYIGLLNTLFAYVVSVYIFIKLISYIPDYLTFILSSIFNISFSYITMSIFVFKNKNFFDTQIFTKYLSSSFLNVLFGVVLSTLLIRLGFDIFITQAISISLAIIIQLLINLYLLTK